MNKSNYKDLASLVNETRKLESKLDEMGAVGKGLWEKADNIKDSLPQGLPDKVLCVALVRNKAMHGAPHIENIDTVLTQTEVINGILSVKNFQVQIDKKLSQLMMYNFDFKNDRTLDTFFTWVTKVNIYKKAKVFNRDDITEIMTNSKMALEAVDVAIKKKNERQNSKSSVQRFIFNLLYLSAVVGFAYFIWQRG